MTGSRVWGLGISVITIFVFLYLIPSTLYHTFAADSTPSANQLHQSDSEARVQSTLEILKTQIASRAAQIKQEINKKLQNKAYAGIVKNKSTKSITIATKSGVKIININQDSVFENRLAKKSKPLTFKDLKEEDYIAGLGDIDDLEALTAKKIILLPNSPAQKTVYWGQVISVNETLVTIKDERSSSSSKDSQTKTISTKSPLKINDQIIGTGTLKNDILESSFVYIYPQGKALKPKKIASPSASVKPTPKPASTKSASPSAKKKST